MKKVAIIDYQLGNLYSVEQAVKHLGADVTVTNDSRAIAAADAVILPGVGAFGEAMGNLERLDLVGPVKDFIASGKPFMGVCLGLQILFTESEEFGVSKGLGLIDGVIKKFSASLPDNEKAKVPQIAWNKINQKDIPWNSTPLNGIETGTSQYFVHSFYAKPENAGIVLATTSYEGFEYCSAILSNNIFACQFHPEKSGETGLQIYNNWLQTI